MTHRKNASVACHFVSLVWPRYDTRSEPTGDADIVVNRRSEASESGPASIDIRRRINIDSICE